MSMMLLWHCQVMMSDQSSNPRYRLVSPAQVPLLVVGVSSSVSRVSIALQPYRIRIQTLGEKSQLNEWEYHFVGKYRGYWKINDFCVLSILTSGKSEGLNMV